jgi:hypothetical protein
MGTSQWGTRPAAVALKIDGLQLDLETARNGVRPATATGLTLFQIPNDLPK